MSGFFILFLIRLTLFICEKVDCPLSALRECFFKPKLVVNVCADENMWVEDDNVCNVELMESADSSVVVDFLRIHVSFRNRLIRNEFWGCGNVEKGFYSFTVNSVCRTFNTVLFENILSNSKLIFCS